MSDHKSEACRNTSATDSGSRAEQLTALAQQARLLEFAFEGETDATRGVAANLETALENAMDADPGEELTRATLAIEVVLGEILSQGMRLSAQMTDMVVEGVLGKSRMPVLTTVLTSPTA